MNVHQQNQKARRGLGIIELLWLRNERDKSFWLAKFVDGTSLEVTVGSWGTTESSVLRKLAQMRKDQQVQY